MIATDISEPHARRLRVGVIAAVFIVALGLADYLSYFFPSGEWLGTACLGVGGIAVFLAGLCGAFCGLSLVFRVHGLHRLVAILTALVSLYAVIRCAGFLGWAINLP